LLNKKTDNSYKFIEKILNSKWPAKRLINRRTDKLNKRIKYDINSTAPKNGAIAAGIPNGTKDFGNCEPELMTPTTKAAIKKVKEICAGSSSKAVIVNVSGTKPDKFWEHIYINKK